MRTASSMLGWPPHPCVSRRPTARHVSRFNIEGAAPASARTQHSPARRAHPRCQQIKCRGLFADAPLCRSRGACESGSGSRPGGRKCEQPSKLTSRDARGGVSLLEDRAGPPTRQWILCDERHACMGPTHVALLLKRFRRNSKVLCCCTRARARVWVRVWARDMARGWDAQTVRVFGL